MTVLGKSMFCNQQCNKYFKQEASTDVKTIGWKIIGEQDNHMVSEYYPIDCFRVTKENWTLRVQKIREHQPTKWLNWASPSLGYYVPPGKCNTKYPTSYMDTWSIPTHTHKFNQNIIIRKSDIPGYGTIYRTALDSTTKSISWGKKVRDKWKPNAICDPWLNIAERKKL